MVMIGLMGNTEVLILNGVTIQRTEFVIVLSAIGVNTGMKKMITQSCLGLITWTNPSPSSQNLI